MHRNTKWVDRFCETSTHTDTNIPTQTYASTNIPVTFRQSLGKLDCDACVSTCAGFGVRTRGHVHVCNTSELL